MPCQWLMSIVFFLINAVKAFFLHTPSAFLALDRKIQSVCFRTLLQRSKFMDKGNFFLFTLHRATLEISESSLANNY